MNFLKIKLGLFSLLTVLAVSVFLTSCEQEIIPTGEVSDVSSFDENLLAVNEDASEVLLPYGYDELSQGEQEQYINSLDEETLSKLIKSAEILNYFNLLGKKDMLLNSSKYGEIYDETTLSLYLTDDEVQGFQLLTDDNTESRWCQCDPEYLVERDKCSWFTHNGIFWHWRYDLYKQECHAWFCGDRYKRKNVEDCN